MIEKSSNVNLALQKYFLEIKHGDEKSKVHSQTDLYKFENIHGKKDFKWWFEENFIKKFNELPFHIPELMKNNTEMQKYW